jgi:hypothetical protein
LGPAADALINDHYIGRLVAENDPPVIGRRAALNHHIMSEQEVCQSTGDAKLNADYQNAGRMWGRDICNHCSSTLQKAPRPTDVMRELVPRPPVRSTCRSKQGVFVKIDGFNKPRPWLPKSYLPASKEARPVVCPLRRNRKGDIRS